MRPASEALSLGHNALQPLFPAAPVGEHAVQKFIEGSPMVGFAYVAEFVRDHVVNGIDRGFDESSIEEQSTRR